MDLQDLGKGRTLPLHAGAASQTLLAFGPPGDREALLGAMVFESFTSRTPLTTNALREKVELAACRGWGFDDGEVIDGVASLAVPVRRRDGSLLGALAVAGLRENVLGQEATAQQCLETAARALTSGLAADGPAHREDRLAVAMPAKGEGALKTSAVIAKASTLMELLAREGIATSTYLTEQLNEPVSSVYRMLSTLADAGWVEQIGYRSTTTVERSLLRSQSVACVTSSSRILGWGTR